MNGDDRIRVVIIDDEPLARSMIIEYLEKLQNFQVVSECCDGFEGAKAIFEHRPHLIFLDIQMPKITGFEMLELLDEKPSVIFTTAYDEFAVKAFEKHAIDYLLKPISYHRFQQAIEKFSNGAGSTSVQVAQMTHESTALWHRFVVRLGNKIKIIPIEDIIHIQADDDYIKITTSEGTFLKKETLSNCEKNLDNLRFARTHRSHMVHIFQIDRLERFEKENYIAILKNGQKVPVSKNGYSKLRQILGK